ncbi:MAG TPA: hypothetical protein VF614_16605 [Chthoniobacteraceae bacterium]|jgi:hypothetical protein
MKRFSFLLLAAAALLSNACEKHPLQGEHNYGSGKHAEFQKDSGVAAPGEASKAAPTGGGHH